jgi:hypothetical protein
LFETSAERWRIDLKLNAFEKLWEGLGFDGSRHGRLSVYFCFQKAYEESELAY